MVKPKPYILVVYKKDAYRRYVLEHRDSHMRRLLSRGQSDLRDMRRSHGVHEASLGKVLKVLRQLPVDVNVVYRANLKLKARKRCTLVVSVGGDGTFLEAASLVESPILGVNSNPARSEAAFCAANAKSFPRLIQKALKGQLPILRLPHLQIRLNGRIVKPRALNDVLIAHDHPATMSRYRLRVGSAEEFQKSSGLWVATAAGSGSAVRAAGGVRLSWGSAKHQYRPRELYQGRLSGGKLTGGVLSGSRSVSLSWMMRRGSIFVDGAHVRIPLKFADRVEVRLLTANPTRVLGLRASHRQMA